MVTVAAGGEYRDPSGFSFTYPEGWSALTKLTAESLLPPEIKRWLATNKFDLNQICVMLVHHGHGDFLETVNVIISPEAIPICDESARELAGLITTQFRFAGMSFESPVAQVRQIGEKQAIVIDLLMHKPGVPVPIRERQFYLTLGGNTYLITCVGSAESFARYPSIFEHMVASFHADASAPSRVGVGTGSVEMKSPDNDGAAAENANEAGSAITILTSNRPVVIGVTVGAVVGMIAAPGAAWKSAKSGQEQLVAAGDGRYRER